MNTTTSAAETVGRTTPARVADIAYSHTFARRLEDLMDEAEWVGDAALAALCDSALAGDHAAGLRCAEVIYAQGG
jgi:hypothetical protein